MYTLEDELFPQPRKPRRWGWGTWVFVIIVGALFVYRSSRPVMRLRADPPPSFYDYSLARNKQERQHERRLARAYWRVAVQQIQKRYSPGSPLPADPPPQFRIGQGARNVEGGVIAGRAQYWYRLREVWRQRDAWDVSYQWNTEWVENSLDSLQQDAPQWASTGLHAVINWVNDIAQRISSAS